MRKTTKRRAPRIEYTSQNRLSFSGFETPFYNQLDPTNRWMVLSNQIPWDDLVKLAGIAPLCLNFSADPR